MNTDTLEGNGVVMTADPDDVDAAGWRRHDVWRINAESSGAYGDDAVGLAYESRYSARQDHGPFVVVDVAYFAEACSTTNLPDVVDAYVVECQITTSTCHDLEDIGGSEIDCTIDYLPADGLYRYTLEDAERIARRYALEDERYKLGTPAHYA
jgi:hypothetical protein